MSFEIVGTSPLQADDKVETADDIRRGDIVCFERLSGIRLRCVRYYTRRPTNGRPRSIVLIGAANLG